MLRSLSYCILFIPILFGANCLIAQDKQEQLKPASDTMLRIRAADARLRQAQADLASEIEHNRQVPGNVSGWKLQRLKTTIEVARQQLEITKQLGHGSAFPNQLVAAQAVATLARQDYEASLKMDKKVPETIGTADIKRLKISAELASIRAEL